MSTITFRQKAAMAGWVYIKARDSFTNNLEVLPNDEETYALICEEFEKKKDEIVKGEGRLPTQREIDFLDILMVGIGIKTKDD